MQQAEHSADENLSHPTSPRALLHPIVLFMAAIVVATGVGMFAILRSDEGSDSLSPRANDVQGAVPLTNAQASERLESLLLTLNRAIGTRDSALLSQITTPDGSVRERSQLAIRRLERSEVFDRTQVRVTQVEVVANRSEEIRIRAVTQLRPCFVSEAGDDITKADALVEQTGTWTLNLQQAAWLLHDGVLTQEEVIDDSNATCS